jgi:hypothetical protein
MNQNTFRLGGGAVGWRRTMLRAGLALAIAVLISLSGRAAAQAADCMSFDACFFTAEAHKAAATQAFGAAVFYSAAADQAAARGDSGAAFLYRTAANQKANETQLHNIARGQALDRAFFFSGGLVDGGVYGGDPGQAPGSCNPQGGDACAAGVQKECSARPLITEYAPKIHGHVIYQAVVGSTWCWRGREIVSRHTNWSEHHLTDFGRDLGLVEHKPYIEPHSACHPFNGVKNWDCLVRIQYGFEKTTGKVHLTYGGCIGVRIYSPETHLPKFSHNHYDGDCKTTN